MQQKDPIVHHGQKEIPIPINFTTIFSIVIFSNLDGGLAVLVLKTNPGSNQTIPNLQIVA
jgi:hypothetical protein